MKLHHLTGEDVVYSEIVKILSRKAKTYRFSKELFQAIKNGNLELMKILLESGAELEPSEVDEAIFPLLVASKFGHVEILKYLLRKTWYDVDHVNASLYVALEYNNVDVALELVSKGASIKNARLFNREDLFLYSVEENHVEALEFFIDLGLHQYFECKVLKTAKAIANEKDYKAIIEQLNRL